MFFKTLYITFSVLYSTGGKIVQEFSIEIHSFQDVRDFVSLATVQPFHVLVGNDRRRVNGKSFMGMFSLDLATPVQVRADCSEEECTGFKLAAARFLAN